jgi:hypothetical protein
MLRLLVLVLLLANVLSLAWGQGWLAHLGTWAAPASTREPQRLQQQLQPERLVLTNSARPPVPAPASPDAPGDRPNHAATAPTPDDPNPATVPAEPTVCLQMGVLNDKQAARLKPLLDEALPDQSWAMETSVQPARWIVYSGKLANAEAVAARRAELRQLRVEFRDVSNPALQPGLALGTYSTEAAAQQALRDVTRAGVKGAKVVAERPETTLYMARVPRATAEQKTHVLKTVASAAGDPWSGKTFQTCP